jgi:putative flavoprotein involved in K+ transport
VESTSVIVIGAGPAGLALSHCLAETGIEHVVLERHDTGHSWRHERWDSLRTLTPNWMNGLPGAPYRGPDPDGFMPAGDVANRLAVYSAAIDAPVVAGTEVSAVRADQNGYVVETNDGCWAGRAVVLATGPGQPRVPTMANDLPSRIQSVTATDYRNPTQLHGERVLVVGASASGVQLADELNASGRHVTVAVGEHVRLPRTYRGRDILWWMQAMGVSARRWDDDVDDLARARQVPSPQLIGTDDRRTLDLRTLRRNGVELVGRLVGVAGARLQFAGSLANLVANADLKQSRLLDEIDAFVAHTGVAASAPHRPPPTDVDRSPTSLDARAFDVVLWATGHRHSPPGVDPAHLDRRGRIIHDGGALRTPGLFVIGLPFLRRRSSTFLSGIGRDAVELAMEVRSHLDRTAVAV